MAKREVPLVVPLPEGIPAYSGRMGLYVARPNHLPVAQIHNDWDIFLVVKGEATWALRGGEVIRGTPGSIVVLPAFTYVSVGEGRALPSFYYCHFDFRAVPGALRGGERSDFTGPGGKALVPLRFDAREAPGVRRAFLRLAGLRDGKPGPPWRLERGLIDLIAELAVFAERRTRRGAPGRPFVRSGVRDERINRIQTQVRNDPVRTWRVHELADLVGLSAGHLHSLCRQVLGRSLKRYLVEMRLQHALKLLKEREGGRRSVKEVAAACGFSTQHFFSRQFKRYYGMSPIEFRDGAEVT